MNKQSGRFTEGQTDKQTECVLLSVHREITCVCVYVCVRKQESVCRFVSPAFHCAFFVCAHSCVPICAVQISHCWAKAL